MTKKTFDFIGKRKIFLFISVAILVDCTKFLPQFDNGKIIPNFGRNCQTQTAGNGREAAKPAWGAGFAPIWVKTGKAGAWRRIRRDGAGGDTDVTGKCLCKTTKKGGV